MPPVVEQDVKRLEAAGVKFRFGQTAGRDFSLNDLRQQGFDYIVVAAGAMIVASRPWIDLSRRYIRRGRGSIRAGSGGMASLPAETLNPRR